MVHVKQAFILLPSLVNGSMVHVKQAFILLPSLVNGSMVHVKQAFILLPSLVNGSMVLHVLLIHTPVSIGNGFKTTFIYHLHFNSKMGPDLL